MDKEKHRLQIFICIHLCLYVVKLFKLPTQNPVAKFLDIPQLILRARISHETTKIRAGSCHFEFQV